MQSSNSAKGNDREDDAGDFMRVDVKDHEQLNFETVEPTLMEPMVIEPTTEQDGTVVYCLSWKELAGSYNICFLPVVF